MSSNDGAPSWLTEETVTAAAKNPTVQKAAVKTASNPIVQKAAVNAAKQHVQDNAPGWATEDSNQKNYAPPAVPGVPVDEAHDVERAGGGGDFRPRNSEFVASEEEIKKIKKYHLFLRIAYMASAFMMSVGAVLSLNGAGISTAFIAFYVLFFAVLIFCFECGLKAVSTIIARNFGFMYSMAGRLVMLIVICGMLVRLDIWAKVAMGLLAASMAGHIFVIVQCPKYEEYLRKKHYYQEKV